jgi:hypothetical protein
LHSDIYHRNYLVINNLQDFRKQFPKFGLLPSKNNQLNQNVMGLFNNREKKLIEELHQKSESHLKEISKEIDYLLEDLTTEYDENQEVVNEFSNFVEELQTKLSPEDAQKLMDFSSRLTKVKRCAKKGVEAMRELARDQRKISRETNLEYQEYYYMR